MVAATQVFISHDTEDAAFAHRLANDLRQLGLRVWVAPDSIRPGEGWVQAINRGLEESSHMVVVLTPAATSSRWVQMETSVAIAFEREGRMELIPLDVVRCKVPALWQSYQRIPFRHNYDAAFGQLANRLGWRAPAPAPARPSARSSMQQGRLYFTKEHTWVRLEGRSRLACGVSDYAQQELADIVYVELPAVNDSFAQGETFATIESIKAAIELPMPLAGQVVGINQELEDAPELVNADPYGNGWLIRFGPVDLSQSRQLIDEANYRAYCETLL